MSTSTEVPSLEATYFPRASLKLYLHPPPECPMDKECKYAEDAHLMTEIADRLKASMARRVPIPRVHPNVSIVLEKRLVSSTRRIPHVWTAYVLDSPNIPTTVVAKIYDPVYLDSEEAESVDPFALLDLTVSMETEAYQRLRPVQREKVPRFYGHFVAPLSAQQDRTVNVVLMEYIHGRDLRDLVPQDNVNTLCSPHNTNVVDAVLRLYFDIFALGVSHQDMQPRNVISRSATSRVQDPPFCATDGCPLRFGVDCQDIKLVLVDFEMVEFEEPDSSLSDPVIQADCVEKLKPRNHKCWFSVGM